MTAITDNNVLNVIAEPVKLHLTKSTTRWSTELFHSLLHLSSGKCRHAVKGQKKCVSLQVSSVALGCERSLGCRCDTWQLWLKLGVFVCNVMHARGLCLAAESVFHLVLKL